MDDREITFYLKKGIDDWVDDVKYVITTTELPFFFCFFLKIHYLAQLPITFFPNGSKRFNTYDPNTFLSLENKY